MRAANQRPILALGIFVMLWALSGCSSSRQPVPPPATGGSLANAHIGAGKPAEPIEPAVAGRPDDPRLDLEHPRVQTLVAGYQTTMRPTLERALQRGNKYLPSMKSTLREEGVPPEFAYGVPIVESGYSLHATSHAGAVGPWQFILGTGKRYGLRIDGYVDERRDPEKATRAAARYLRDLYDRFGDWHLALAAYNTGEGNIERIKARKGCEDFWEMRDRGFLPSETSEYVPKVLAAMEVARSAKQYGINVVKSPPQTFDVIQVSRPISLKAVAQLTGSDLDTIKELNPALKRGVVPPDGYEVRLPEGTREQFTVALASYREPPPVLYAEQRSRRGGSYRVRSGDTLSRIAKRHGVSVHALQRANRLRNGRSIHAGQRLEIPGAGGSTQVATAASSQRAGANRSRRHVQQSSRSTAAKRRVANGKRPAATQRAATTKRPATTQRTVNKQRVVNKQRTVSKPPAAKPQVSKATPRSKVANAPKRSRDRYN